MNKVIVFLIPTLTAAISMWLLAGLWHKIMAAAFYTAEVGATHEDTGIIFVAYLILASLMVYLYSFYTKSERFLIEGFKFGAIIGLLWVFPHELAMAGAHEKSLSYVFKNALWHMVEQGVGGIIIALVYHRYCNRDNLFY